MEKLKTDVAVIGTGGAGIAAALTAAESGASVIVFEKKKLGGGISKMGMGIFGVESRRQRELNVPFKRDDAFNLFMELTKWRADPYVVRAYIDKSGPTIDWLEKMGVEFELCAATTFPGAVPLTGHLVKAPNFDKGFMGVPPGWLGHMVKIMQDNAVEKGVEIRRETAVKKILKQGERVTGLVAETKSGDTIEVEAKAVVIASGGYLNDKEFYKEHAGGFEMGQDFVVRLPVQNVGQTAEGIRMAWEVGADSDGIYPQINIMIPLITSLELDLFVAAGLPHLWINQRGERFLNEAQGDPTYVTNAIYRQKDRCFYAIFDASTRKYMEEEGMAPVLSYGYPFPNPSDIDASVNRAIKNGEDKVYAADSLADLAKMMGVNPDALQKTVDEYNKSCDKGRDDILLKDPQYLRPVKEPRFYAFKGTSGGHATFGGIKINGRAEVVDKEGEVIPGLYAAGDCANGASTHHPSLRYILWGGAIGFAVNIGRVAGESASKYSGK